MTSPDFIPWNGGECPVPPGTRVSTRLRGEEYMDGPAIAFRWAHIQDWGDIIAYRVLEPAAGKDGLIAELCEALCAAKNLLSEKRLRLPQVDAALSRAKEAGCLK